MHDPAPHRARRHGGIEINLWHECPLSILNYKFYSFQLVPEMISQTLPTQDKFHWPTEKFAKFFPADFEVKINFTKCPINEGKVQRTLSPNINVIQWSWKVKSGMLKPEVEITKNLHHYCWAALFSLVLSLPCNWTVFPLDMHAVQGPSHPFNAMLL